MQGATDAQKAENNPGQKDELPQDQAANNISGQEGGAKDGDTQAEETKAQTNQLADTRGKSPFLRSVDPELMETMSNPALSENAQKILGGLSVYIAKRKQEFMEEKGALADGEGHEWNKHAGDALATLAEDLKGTAGPKRDVDGAQTMPNLPVLKPPSANEHGPKSQLASELLKVHAFEIETRLSRLIESLVGPIAALGQENAERLQATQRFIDSIQHGQTDLLEKLENTRRLKDLILEFQNLNKASHRDTRKELDDLKTKVGAVQQLTKVHEDRVARLNDDRKIYETRQYQLRKDIREFEKLCVDVSYANKSHISDLKADYTKEMNNLLEEMDEVSKGMKDVQRQVKFQKSVYNDVLGQIGWTKFQINSLTTATEDIPVLKNQLTATDKYLGTVLPFHIQNQIHKACMAVVANTPKKQMRLDVLEHSAEEFHELKEGTTEKGFKLNKVDYRIPDLRDQINDIRELLAEGEEEPEPARASPVFQPPVEQMMSPMSQYTPVVFSREEGNQGQASGLGIEQQRSRSQFSAKQQLQPFSQNSTVGGAINIQFNKNQLDFIARKVGKRLLFNDPFLDDLADVLDGLEPQNEYSDSEEDESGSPRGSKMSRPRRGKSGAELKLEPTSQANSGSSDSKESQNDSEESEAEAKDSGGVKNMLPKRREDILDRKPEKPQKDSRYDAEVTQNDINQEDESGSQNEQINSSKQSEAAKNDPSNQSEQKKPKKTQFISSRSPDADDADLSESPSIRDDTSPQPDQAPPVAKSGPSDSNQTRPPPDKSAGPLTFEDGKAPQASVSKGSARYQSPQPAQPSQPSPDMNDLQVQKSSTLPQQKSKSKRRGNKDKKDQKDSKGQKLYKKVTIRGENSPIPSTIESQARGRRGRGKQAPFQADDKIQMQLDDLKDQMKYVSFKVKQFFKQETLEDFEVVKMLADRPKDEEPEERSEHRAARRSPSPRLDEDSESVKKGGYGHIECDVNTDEFVKVTEFKKFQAEYIDVRKGLREVREKLQELEMKEAGPPSGVDAVDYHIEQKRQQGVYDRFEKTQVEWRKQADELFEQVELLKLEQKKELKRLQRQNFLVNSEYTKYTKLVQDLDEKTDELNKRCVLSDTAMAVLFKMLRIQYALSHQDELDRQDMFLMGFKDVGTEADQGVTENTKNLSSQNQSNLQDLGTSSVNDEFTEQKSIDSVESKKKSIENSESLKDLRGQLLKGVTSSKGHQILAIDKNCLQCADSGSLHKHAPMLMKGFKMACLSYKPSKVIFDQKAFDRNALIEAEGHMLYLALQLLTHLDFDQVERVLLGEAAKELEQRSSSGSVNKKTTIALGLPNQSKSNLYASRIVRDASLQQSPSLNDVFSGRGPSKMDEQLDTTDMFNSHMSRDVIDTCVPYAPHPNDSFDMSILSTNQNPHVASSKLLRGVQASGKLISFAKSKQYAKLASQIPTILGIEHGKKVLNNSDLISAGIFAGGSTPQDQYHKNIKNLKLYERQLRQQRQTLSQSKANAEDTPAKKSVGKNKKLKQRNVLYSQANRESLNLTTIPPQVDMGLPLQSLDHSLLCTEPPVLTPGRRKLPPQGPQDPRLDAGMINILNENPLTPNSINKKFLRKPQKLATMGIGAIKLDALTPKNEDAGSKQNPLSRAFERERPEKQFDHCLSSRPLRFNRLGGITGNSIALIPSDATVNRGNILSSMGNLDKQAGLAQKASLPNLALQNQVSASHKYFSGISAERAEPSSSTARAEHLAQHMLAGILKGGATGNTTSNHNLMGSHLNPLTPNTNPDLTFLVPQNQQEFTRTDGSCGGEDLGSAGPMRNVYVGAAREMKRGKKGQIAGSTVPTLASGEAGEASKATSGSVRNTTDGAPSLHTGISGRNSRRV